MCPDASCCLLLTTPLPPPTAAPQFKDEPAALKLKHDGAGVVGFANSGKWGGWAQQAG